MFGLVDGNNFYASCEQLFQPKLIGKPMVVLLALQARERERQAQAA